MQITTHKGTYQGRPVVLQRIHKSTAIKLHSEGKTVFMQSSNLPPFPKELSSDWSAVKMDSELNFERQVEIYSYFNSNIAQGYRVKFYSLVNH